MTSPLQQAFEAAQADDAEPQPIVCTVAGPRLPFPAESYTGAELRATSTRPGAYDALALPSVFNGRRTAPPAPPVNFVHTSGLADPFCGKAKGRRFTVIDSPDPSAQPGPYLPKPGSIPSRALAYLKEHGGHLTYTDIHARFGLPPSGVTAVFKKAIESHALMRCTVDKRAAFALPDYVPPADTPRQPKGLHQVADLEQQRGELRGLITQ